VSVISVVGPPPLAARYLRIARIGTYDGIALTIARVTKASLDATSTTSIVSTIYSKYIIESKLLRYYRRYTRSVRTAAISDINIYCIACIYTNTYGMTCVVVWLWVEHSAIAALSAPARQLRPRRGLPGLPSVSAATRVYPDGRDPLGNCENMRPRCIELNVLSSLKFGRAFVALLDIHIGPSVEPQVLRAQNYYPRSPKLTDKLARGKLHR
jgi:hypothetical protein